jgi:hypothetical protein
MLLVQVKIALQVLQAVGTAVEQRVLLVRLAAAAAHQMYVSGERLFQIEF